MNASEGLIFVAEDNEDDVELLMYYLAQACVPCRIERATDGADALEKLGRLGKDECPVMIILDVRMPRGDGFEVLEWIRRRPEFAAVPVFMLSTSRLQRDIEQAKLLGAQAYFEKFPPAKTFASLFSSAAQFAGMRAGDPLGFDLPDNLMLRGGSI